MTGPAEKPGRKPRQATSSFNLKQLTALHRSAYQQLLTTQRGEYAHLRSMAGRSQASALAQAEIAVEFAQRWADVRRLPLAERAAAIAALRAEQSAALASRLIQHTCRLRDMHRANLAAVRPRHAMERRALSHRHRQTWAAAAAALSASRQQHQTARPPPNAHTHLTRGARLS